MATMATPVRTSTHPAAVSPAITWGSEPVEGVLVCVGGGVTEDRPGVGNGGGPVGERWAQKWKTEEVDNTLSLLYMDFLWHCDTQITVFSLQKLKVLYSPSFGHVLVGLWVMYRGF